jgi:hypothetical protein
MAMWVWERERKRRLPCNRADRGCVAFFLGQHYLAGNGANFSPVLTLETVYGTDVGSNANDDGALPLVQLPARFVGLFPLPCESAANQYRVGLIFK